MNPGEGVVSFGQEMPDHGDIDEYAYAVIPAPDDSGWALAPDAEMIGFEQASKLPADSCREYGDFTYFQTFVYIPAAPVPAEFVVALDAVDDGARVTVFNSNHPEGMVVDESYVFLAGTGVTGNLANLIQPGEANRIVVTHVDDCPYACVLGRAEIRLDSRTVTAPPVLRVSWDAEGVEVRWNSYEGHRYQLEYADALLAGQWVPWGEPAPGTGTPMAITDSTAGRPQRFYRLLLLPQN